MNVTCIPVIENWKTFDDPMLNNYLIAVLWKWSECTDVPVKLQEIHNIITNNRIEVPMIISYDNIWPPILKEP